jgi:hypothetical protein
MHCSQRAVWRNGGITPQTILWEIERYYPAASSVEAATAPSRRDVSGNAGATVQKIKKIRYGIKRINIQNL